MPAPGYFAVDSADARAAAAAVRRAGDMAGARMISATQGTMSSAYGEELAKTQGSAVQKLVIATGARSYGTGFGLAMKAATSGSPLSGGLIPSVWGRAFEFGTQNRQPTTYTQRSRKGKSYRVTRVSTRQMPLPSRSGWVAYPAASKVFPRVLEMWLQILVLSSHEAIETRS